MIGLRATIFYLVPQCDFAVAIEARRPRLELNRREERLHISGLVPATVKAHLIFLRALSPFPSQSRNFDL
jgi:hypothetical protein